MGAVKNAMQRDEQDPSIMDLDAERSLESQRPPANMKNDAPPLKDDPLYSKYFKMMKMVRALCKWADILMYRDSYILN